MVQVFLGKKLFYYFFAKAKTYGFKKNEELKRFVFDF